MYPSLIKIYFWSLEEESKDQASETGFGEHDTEAWWLLFRHVPEFMQSVVSIIWGPEMVPFLQLAENNNRFFYLII